MEYYCRDCIAVTPRHAVESQRKGRQKASQSKGQCPDGEGLSPFYNPPIYKAAS